MPEQISLPHAQTQYSNGLLDGIEVNAHTEGADDAEIILRPAANGRWRVEAPTGQAVVVTVVTSEREAIALAHAIRPDADVRFLPAVE